MLWAPDSATRLAAWMRKRGRTGAIVETGTNVARGTGLPSVPFEPPCTTTPESAPIDTRATSTKIPTRTEGSATTAGAIGFAAPGAAGAAVTAAGTERGCCMVRQAAATSQAPSATPTHAAPEIRQPRGFVTIRATFH